MRLQVLSSGSAGNSALLRAGDCTVLVDAGLGPRAMRERMDAAGLGFQAVDHVLVTHGHLDHARSAGVVARRERAVVHAAQSLLGAPSLRRAPRQSAFTVHRPLALEDAARRDALEVLPVLIPHDARPTVAYRLEHGGRVAAVITDLGRPDREAAGRLAGAHVLVLEFNHDPGMLAVGPYPPALQRRVGGDHGHLSNEQAATMLRHLAGPELHTLVLAHLSEVNNRPELALAAARETLDALGLGRVRVLVASQHEVGPSLEV